MPEPAADTPVTGFTVADLARRWRVSEDKIRTFLHRGEFVSVNLAVQLGGQAAVADHAGIRGEVRRKCTAPRHPSRRGVVAPLRKSTLPGLRCREC